MTISIYYFNTRPNFGDLLNIDIPKKIFNVDIIKEEVKKCEATFIGSILNPFLTTTDLYINKVLKIWGSGFIKPDLNTKTKLIRPIEVFAVRGKYTKARLEKYTQKKLKDVVLGDPGLLCSYAYSNLDTTKEYEWGIIPHYVDLNHPNLKKLKLKDSIIINPTLSPDEFIKKLVKCKKILSSAMHGLIAADSFCIPNMRLIIDDKIVGGDYKYNDYYSAFDMTSHDKLDLRLENIYTDIKINYTITPEQIKKIQNNLIERFPFK